MGTPRRWFSLHFAQGFNYSVRPAGATFHVRASTMGIRARGRTILVDRGINTTLKHRREGQKQGRLGLAARVAVENLESRTLLAANPVITEFMASNGGTLLDG